MHLTIIAREYTVPMPAYDILKAQLFMSNLMIKRIRLYGKLLVNQTPQRMKELVNPGDQLDIFFQEEELPAQIKPTCTIPLYYEDEFVVVCEKPGNLVTHPSWQHMEDSLIQRLSNQRLHPIMRLDRETSGLIVIAKNGFAHNVVAKSPMEKYYQAIVHGSFTPKAGTINLPIDRSPNSIMIREVLASGKSSITHYKTLKVSPCHKFSLVEFKLETGRCHQIRVHSQYLKHPVMGDGLYGPRSNDFFDPSFPTIEIDSFISRQALHASYLSFIHPLTQEKLAFTSPLPPDMQEIMEQIDNY